MATAYLLDLLPVTNGLPFEYDFTLSNVIYYLKFRYNQRLGKPTGGWRMDVKDPAKSPIALGVLLVLKYPLLSRCSDPRKPPGHLVLIDESGQNEPPGPNDLGDRCKLYYVV